MSSQEPSSYLAFDLGASTSRAFLGTLRDNILVMNELHRFATPVLEINNHLFWDIDLIWEELQQGFLKALATAPALKSLSVDSWAVDYVSLDASGVPIQNPHCYRDPRTDGVMERAFDTVSKKEIFDITGIQFLPFNTLFQLLTDAERTSPDGVLDSTDGVAFHLPIADYFNFRFSGRPAVEVSMASTTQMMDVQTRHWSSALMERFGLDPGFWPEIIPSGTLLGPALEAPLVSVVATCSHDTGSAVAAAPAVGSEGNWAFISSGTWSLLGVERQGFLLSDAAREAGFTNEAGLDGTVRLLKNLTGLWVLQECMREWRSAGALEWPELEREAREVLRLGVQAGGGKQRGKGTPGSVFVNLEDAYFLARGNMECRIRAYCRENGTLPPESRGEIVLVILSSIAESYRRALSELEDVTGKRYERIHLFGGGSQNELLCQLTADACRIQVIAGPVEAAAMGNLLIQARTTGDLPVGTSIRDIASKSSQLTVYSPNPI